MDSSLLKKISIGMAVVSAVAGIFIYRAYDGPGSREAGASTAAGTTRKATHWEVGGNYNLTQWGERIADTPSNDLQALIEEAMKIGDANLRKKVIEGIVDRWLKEDIQGFTKYWAALEVHGADDKLAMLALALQGSLTKLDETRAASDEIYIVVQRLISYLASSDPELALQWAKKWLLDDAQEHALVAVARNMARTDVNHALAIIADMKSPVRRGQAVAAVAIIWASRDLNAALAWAGGLPNTIERALVA